MASQSALHQPTPIWLARGDCSWTIAASTTVHSAPCNTREHSAASASVATSSAGDIRRSVVDCCYLYPRHHWTTYCSISTYGALRFSYLHAAAIGSDASGRDVPTKFIAAHRLQVDPSPQLSVAISDAIVYSGRGIDLAYLNPLGFYVSNGMLSGERNERDNSLLAAEVGWRPLDGTLLYGTLLADDIGFSTLADTSWRGNNNKYAWHLGGAQLLRTADVPIIIAAEYVRINPFVYAHRTIVNSWTSQGEVLGALQQPNSDRWTLAVTLLLAPRMRLALRADYIRWGENWLDSTGHVRTAVLPGTTLAVPVGNVGGDANDGNGDVLPEPFAVGNRFLRGNVSHTRRVQAWVSLEPIANVFFDLRAEYVLRTGGNTPLERWWWWVQLRIGY